jgi:hypothetical protein
MDAKNKPVQIDFKNSARNPSIADPTLCALILCMDAVAQILF